MKRIPAAGIVGAIALREAAASEFGDIAALVRSAVRQKAPDAWITAMYPDRAIVHKDDGRDYAYGYTIDDSNMVALSGAVEVVKEYVPAAADAPARESASHNTPAERHAEGGADNTHNGAALAGEVFIEAIQPDDGAKPTRYLVRVIRAGTSLNRVTYPASILREAVKLFDGVRVFVKSDDEHLKGGGKDFRQLVGRLTEAAFVSDGPDGGEIQAVLDVLESSDVAAKLREAVSRGMTELFGLSIDATGRSKKSGKFREATKLTKVASVDLIIEPGAGGQFIRFAEAKHTPQEEDTMLRSQMIQFIEARDAKRAGELAEATDEEVLTAYKEAVKAEAAATATADGQAVTSDEVSAQIRMVEARANARIAIAGSKLPDAIQERLVTRFSEAANFKVEDVTDAIDGERKFLGRLVEGAQVRGLGEGIEMGEGRAEKVSSMLDDFFDRTKPAMSFKECYREITGESGVITGQLANCDMQRLREAAGERNFREAISSSTFSDILGDSITRAMIREYQGLPQSNDWRWLCDVVAVSDFRKQERTRLGGYGSLPTVAENGAYAALTSPGDEAASYSPSKKGGTETISLETIANDDMGLIRRIPQKLALSAAQTLYEFVYDFLADNPTIYDAKTLFHADHNNAGTAALGEAGWAAALLAMRQQTELSSAKRLGIALKHLAIPSDLWKTAYDLFVRDTNIDKTFVQNSSPSVHVVDYWTDANNWFGTADSSQVPLIELGFYGGEEPQLFTQDQPNQGSLFSNDQIKYKIRHIYGGGVLDYRGFYGATVA